MPLLRNCKSVNKCFEDTFNDCNVSNHFSLQTEVTIFAWREQKLIVCITEEKENLYKGIDIFFPLMQSQVFLREGEVRNPLFLALQK